MNTTVGCLSLLLPVVVQRVQSTYMGLNLTVLNLFG